VHQGLVGRLASLVVVGSCTLGVQRALAGQQEAPRAPTRGIAVLASGLGREYPVEAFVRLVEAGEFSPVVIDWAWITAHWEQTDFGAVNEVLGQLARRGTPTAAMYRPRFLADPTVSVQVKADGSPAEEHGSEICFSSPEARAWGAAWGRRILEKCPDLGEIIIYNPRNLCECPACTEAQRADPGAGYAGVWTFLREARELWRAQSPSVKLGVVFGGDPEFWRQGLAVCDVAHPYLYVRDGTDRTADAEAAEAVGELYGPRLGACLAKITWGETDKVTPEWLAEFDRTARDRGLSYFLWTFDTAFRSSLYDPSAVAQALGLDSSRVGPASAALSPPLTTGLEYTDDEIRAASVETLLARMAAPEPGLAPWAASRALERKATLEGAAAYEEIVARAIGVVRDDARPQFVRLQCAYVLSGLGDPRGVPVLAHTLLTDTRAFMRTAAASALGAFDAPEAAAALRQAAETETDATALEWIRKSLDRTATRGAERALLDASLAGRRVAFAVVKDFMLIENSEGELEEVTFERYAPAVDAEQVVLARQLTARSDAGQEVPARIADVTPDAEGNLIHTFALDRFPAEDRVLVTLTSLVARRERPQPHGAFPIPEPDEYPPEVRPFLQPTPMVAADDPAIVAQAEALLAESRDAYVVAQKLAEVMKAKPYLPPADADFATVPAAVAVLRYGGSCCVSAVGAAAVLRACGIPAQLTYCPAGYIHGIVQFYLWGYGWVRMDATCGTGKLPLVQSAEDLGLVRLFDMPIGMEDQPMAYGWPYYQTGAQGSYTFGAAGAACPALRFVTRESEIEGAPAGTVSQPFPHLESGSWNRVLGGEPLAGAWTDWSAIEAASRAAVISGAVGEFRELTARLPESAAYVTQLCAE